MADEVYVVVKYDYTAQEDQELTVKKNERLKLIDDTKNWWKVCFYVNSVGESCCNFGPPRSGGEKLCKNIRVKQRGLGPRAGGPRGSKTYIFPKKLGKNLKTGVPSLLIFQKSADFEMSNLAKSDFSVSNLIFEMRNFVKFIRNIMEN